MTVFERRMVLGGMALLLLSLSLWLSGASHLSSPIARASKNIPYCTSPNGYCLAYFGADLSANGGMQKATGVASGSPKTKPSGPWPQYAGNYCFLAVVQALTNYEDWKDGIALSYPHASDEGPPAPSGQPAWTNGTPVGEVSPQLLWDMDTNLKPTFGTLSIIGSGQNRKPFTLANSSYDFGGDPRSQAYATWWETPGNHFYHDYIYHNGVGGASLGLAQALATTFSDGFSPAIALVNQGEHAVVVAGVWSYGSPFVSNPVIDSFAVYNPWNQDWGSFINGAYYERVSYANWTSGVSSLQGRTGQNTYWWAKTYNSNGGSDPDPHIGIYQAGCDIDGCTSNPNAHHWITNYVAVERDTITAYNANYTIDENGNVMQSP